MEKERGRISRPDGAIEVVCVGILEPGVVFLGEDVGGKGVEDAGVVCYGEGRYRRV